MPLLVGIGIGDIGPADIVATGEGEGYGCAALVIAWLQARTPTASASPKDSVSMRVFIGLEYPKKRTPTHA
jgi:hypothetical protein